MVAVLVYAIYTLLVWVFVNAADATTEITHRLLSMVAPFIVLPLLYVINGFRSADTPYNALKEEHTALILKNAELARLTPNLVPEVVGMIFGGYCAHPPLAHHRPYLIMMRIYNTGTPSVLRNWRAYIEKNGKRHEIRADIPNGTLTMSATSGPSVTFTTGNSLVLKTREPIAQGGQVEGYLYYYTEISSHVMLDDKDNLIITFQDVTGKIYETTGRGPEYANEGFNPFIIK